jgi:hypothetical protein
MQVNPLTKVLPQPTLSTRTSQMNRIRLSMQDCPLLTQKSSLLAKNQSGKIHSEESSEEKVNH